jgi:integrase
MPRKQREEGFWLAHVKGSPFLYIHWYDPGSGRTRRRSTGEQDHRKAQIVLAEHILKHQRPLDAEPEEMRMAVVLADYLEWIILRPSGHQACIAASHFEAFFGAAFVSDLTLDRQEAYIAARRSAGIADSTISRELSVLRAALNRAYKRGVLRSAPFIMDLPKAEPRDRWLRSDEVARLLDCFRSPHLRLFTLLALHTAARPGAVLGLKWSQVDFEGRVIHLNPPGRLQGSKRRPSVPMTDTLYAVLREALGRARSEHVIEYHGRAIASVKKSFVRAAKAAGLSDVTQNTLRHTAATRMAQAGVPMWEVAGMMGHSTSRMTEKVYAKHHPDYMTRAASALDSAFGEISFRANNAQVGDLDKIIELPEMRKPLVSQGLPMVGAAGIEPATPTMST